MLLALLAVRIFKGTLVVRATMTGLAFAVLGVAQLLYTNSYMPRAVRLPHLIEIGVSNALFGALAAVLLIVPRRTVGARGARRRATAPIAT